MKCLTINQPWAWAIIHGAKRVENRSWPTRFRGTLLIHAGKSRKWKVETLPDGSTPPTNLVYGAIIGRVEIVDCVPVEDLAGDPWAFGPWCWSLANPQPLTPIAYKGQLSLFNVPDSVLLPFQEEASAERD